MLQDILGKQSWPWAVHSLPILSLQTLPYFLQSRKSGGEGGDRHVAEWRILGRLWVLGGTMEWMAGSCWEVH